MWHFSNGSTFLIRSHRADRKIFATSTNQFMASKVALQKQSFRKMSGGGLAELGHPELDGDKWRALENRVFDLLDSGGLTISAEGKSYVLPPVNAPRCRARFQKIC
jgi:hypothetical protein